MVIERWVDLETRFVSSSHRFFIYALYSYFSFDLSLAFSFCALYFSTLCACVSLSFS